MTISYSTLTESSTVRCFKFVLLKVSSITATLNLSLSGSTTVKEIPFIVIDPLSTKYFLFAWSNVKVHNSESNFSIPFILITPST